MSSAGAYQAVVRFIAAAIVLLACLYWESSPVVAAEPSTLFRWEQLPRPPAMVDEERFRLAVAGDALIAIPLNPAVGSIAILPEPHGVWRTAALAGDADWKAVRIACGHGAVVVADDDRLICFGGSPRSDATFSIRFDEGVLRGDQLPSLPEPVVHGCGAVLDNVLYVIAGDSEERENRFWMMDLKAPPSDARWLALTPYSGLSRSHATAIALDGSVLMFGGAGQGGHALDDAYRWRSREGWTSVAKMPDALIQPAAMRVGQSHVLLVDDRAQKALYYHTITDTWRAVEIGWLLQPDIEIAQSAMAIATAGWRGAVVIADDDTIAMAELRRASRGLAAFDVAVISGYLLLLIGMGFWFARRERSSDDYFRAGQRIPWWAAGISLLGTSLSAITFMALPAMAYRTDWVYLLGNLMIVAVAPPVIWYYLPFYRRLEVTSAYEYLERRFGLATRLLGTATFLLFQVGRMAVVVYLPALALSAVTGWNVFVCIAAIGLLATFYTTLGGIEAVIWTDVLQVAVLLGGALISLAVIMAKVPGGAGEMASSAWVEGKLHAVNLTWDAASTGLWVVVLGNFFKFLIPYSSDQAVIQRYLTTRDERQAARSIWLNAVASVPVWTIFFALGTMLWSFYRVFPDRLDPTGRTDEIFAWFIVQELPTGIAGLVVAALFAASMSSLDSSLNSMATALTTDFLRLFRASSSDVRPPLETSSSQRDDDRDALAFARLVTVLLGIIGTLAAAWLAWVETQSIWDQFLKMMGLFGGGLAGLFVAGIFTRRTHQTGVLVGFVVSAAVLYFARVSGAVHLFLYGGIGILTCSIVGWLMSHVLPGPRKDVSGLTVHSLRKHADKPHRA
jgi:SSS family transporter